ncbi:MAG: AAA family ATPase [Deltaproteobacteria bacterium]|nr:AAA family ATPase [Deltaproteobacteria bacterium]
MPLEKVAIYGKGGIGKSVVAAHLSAELARRGLRVLHVGCDPKADSTCRLTGSPAVRTVLGAMRADPDEIAAAQIITTGRLGIDCIEAGGPEPGAGCGGRGVARAIEVIGELRLLQGGRYDAAIFDVLGDVVCGGFAAPLRKGFAGKVLIVVSEETMALFAANNIARAIVANAFNGAVLAGIVVNLRSAGAAQVARVHEFATLLGTRVVLTLERSGLISNAERELMTVVETAPGSDVASAFRELADHILRLDASPLPSPTPLEGEAFFKFARG